MHLCSKVDRACMLYASIMPISTHPVRQQWTKCADACYDLICHHSHIFRLIRTQLINPPSCWCNLQCEWFNHSYVCPILHGQCKRFTNSATILQYRNLLVTACTQDEYCGQILADTKNALPVKSIKSQAGAMVCFVTCFTARRVLAMMIQQLNLRVRCNPR